MKRFINNYKYNYSEKFKYLNDLNISDNTTFKLPFIIDSNYMLKLYNINTIQELNIYIKNNIEIINIYEIINIINYWVYENFKTLKNNKPFLIDIIFNTLLIYNSNKNPNINKQDYIDRISENIDKYISLTDITNVNFFSASVVNLPE